MYNDEKQYLFINYNSVPHSCKILLTGGTGGGWKGIRELWTFCSIFSVTLELPSHQNGVYQKISKVNHMK